jgi:hypothetical protein
MYYLIYVSQAERPMRSEELSDILKISRKHNQGDDITGLLIYRFTPSEERGNFMQLLEGSKQKVNEAFARIAADKRHHTKIVLEEGEIPARSFPDWTMGFRDVEATELEGFDGYSDLGSAEFWRRARAGSLRDALELMRSFYANAQ